MPSFPLIVVTNLLSRSAFASSSPKLTMSMFTFSFFNFLANLTISFSSASMGEPTKATILVLWFFPCLCFSAKWAILMPEINLMSPVGATWFNHYQLLEKRSKKTWCNFAKIFPVSVVRVTRTARSARVIKATLDSGFDLRRKRSLISKLQVFDRCSTLSLSG